MSSTALFAITHQRAPLDVLEQVSLAPDDARTVAEQLREQPGIDEVVVVSTCNRIELYLAGDAPDPSRAAEALAARCGLSAARLTDIALVERDDDAARHLFRVAAGLESRLVGEGEILGQVRASIARARSAGLSGRHLQALFRFATAAGRRARRVPDGPAVPSLARVALDSAAPDLAGWPVRFMVIGAGAVAAAVTQELAARGADYVVCARREAAASRLAPHGTHVLPIEDLGIGLEHVDVVVCATSARSPLLSSAQVRRTLADRPRQPLVVVDLGLPRNVDPEVRSIPNVHLLDLDDLTGHHGDLMLRRRERVVGEEHGRYRLWQAGQDGAELIARLRRHVEADARLEARELIGARGSAAELQRAARRIAGRRLHAPVLAIKERIAEGDPIGAAAIASAASMHDVGARDAHSA